MKIIMPKRLIYIWLILGISRIGGFSYPLISDVQIMTDSITMTSWSLIIEARMSGLHDSSATFGVRPDATTDFDQQYDRPCPPNPPGDWLQVYFPHTGGHWPTILGTKFMVDISTPDTTNWILNVESSFESGPLTLSWDTSEINKLPSGYDIMMKDAETGDTIRMRQHPSYLFQYSSLRIFSIWSEFNGVVVSVAGGWNLLSVPRIPPDYSKLSLFPSAISSAFVYDGSYVEQSILEIGKGFWLKYSDNQNAYLSGSICLLDTVELNGGWNIIGSISESVSVGSIASIPPGSVTSDFYGYDGAYYSTTYILPGFGYWVKVSQKCELILSSSGNSSAESLIKIIPTADRPPLPPGVEITGSKEPTPTSIVLGQNYPNPFNPTSIIQYELPEQAHIRIMLINVLGKEVAQLTDGVENAGLHQLSVDGNTQNLSSGVYYYKVSGVGLLTGQTYEAIKKLLFIK